MIASVARDSGRTVESVGADSYALTLWAYLHGKDAQRMADVATELEHIDLAEMVTRGFIGGTKELEHFRTEWKSKVGGSSRASDLEEIKRAGEELEARHQRGLAFLSGDLVS